MEPTVDFPEPGNPTRITCGSDGSAAETPCDVRKVGIEVPLHFAQDTLRPSSRLGLAVAIEKQGTPSSSGLQFMYDHPSFDSRLSVDTHSLVPVF